MGNKPYSNLQCPDCGIVGDFQKDENEEVYCNCCGLVIESAYPYTAGIRFKTLLDILLEEDEEENGGCNHDRITEF